MQQQTSGQLGRSFLCASTIEVLSLKERDSSLDDDGIQQEYVVILPLPGMPGAELPGSESESPFCPVTN